MPVPLTIIGGFLGSGKTTLLNRILSEPQGRRFAVIVNDFGDIAIDEDLIASHDGQTIALANGCVCCTIGDNFLRTLLETLKLDPQPDHIVVEASGVADPARIAEIAAIERDLTLDGVIILVDAAGLESQVSDSRLLDTIERQIDSADIVVLNKTDLADEAEAATCREWIVRRRPNLPVAAAQDANVPFELLFGIEKHSSTGGHVHSHDIPFETRAFETDQVVSKSDLEKELLDLAPHIVRAKGVVETGDDGWSIVQMVGERIDWLAAPSREGEASRLVVIGPAPLCDLSSLESLFVTN